AAPRAAALPGGAPGRGAAMTPMTGLTTATVAAVRSASSWVTRARSASCSARPDSWRYTVTSSRRTMFSRPRSRADPAGTARPAAGRVSVTSAAYDRNREWALWVITKPRPRDRGGGARKPSGDLDNRRPGCAHFREVCKILTSCTSLRQRTAGPGRWPGLLEYRDIYAGGRLLPSASPDAITVANPATEEIMGAAPAASGHDVDVAVRAAREAFDSGPWP